MEKIIKEKISADHLLYVSLKYTKTCDVIINLLLRWKIMIELATDKLIERAKKEKSGNQSLMLRVQSWFSLKEFILRINLFLMC